MRWLQLTVCIFLLAAAQGKIRKDSPEAESNAIKGKAQEGDVKLEYGPDNTEGVAMFFHNGQWGTICDQKGFRPRGWASVFCRQLHGEGWEAVGIEHVRDIEGKKHLMDELAQLPLGFEKPNCFPHSTEHMKDCPLNDPDYFCQRGHEQDTWVTCAPVDVPEEGPCLQDGMLRLVNKEGVVNKIEGRAEMFVDGKWGTICDAKGFGPKGWAAVFCKQLLGYTVHNRYDTVREVAHVADMPGFETWGQDDHTDLPLNMQVPNCFVRNTSALIDCGWNWRGGIEKCERWSDNQGKYIQKGHEWDVWIKC